MSNKSGGMSLHTKITLGMFAGLLLGMFIYGMGTDNSEGQTLALWWTDFIGKGVFVSLLKMLIAPLIFASIVAGVTSLPDSKELGAIGWKTFGFYIMTTTIAVTIGIVMVQSIKPGDYEDPDRASVRKLREDRVAELKPLREEWIRHHPGRDPLATENVDEYRAYIAEISGEKVASSGNAKNWGRIEEAKEKSPKDMIKDKIVGPILSNPFKALAEGNTLGIIAFAILMGLACVFLGDSAQPVVAFFKGLNDVIMKVTLWVMEIAPYCIAALMADTVGRLGIDGLIPLLWYGGTVVGGILIHLCVLMMLVKFLGKMQPKEFIQGIRNAWMVAFTTTSSSATLPVTMECVTQNLKVDKKIAGFTLPVGATMNMDGTALYEGIAVIFMIQVYNGLDDVNIVMTLGTTIVIFIASVLASVGAATIPSAGLVTMTIVASVAGLPVHYIAYLWTIDHLLDMFRTSTNITGDAAAAVVVNHWEKGRLGAS